MTNSQNGHKMYLSRDMLRGLSDVKTEEVVIPEWEHVTVIVKGMTATERDLFDLSHASGRGKNREVNLSHYRAKMVAWCVVDEQGNRVFDEADAEWLGEKSAAALSRICDVAARLSGISQADEEELTAELKNGQSADSPSA